MEITMKGDARSITIELSHLIAQTTLHELAVVMHEALASLTRCDISGVLFTKRDSDPNGHASLIFTDQNGVGETQDILRPNQLSLGNSINHIDPETALRGWFPDAVLPSRMREMKSYCTIPILAGTKQLGGLIVMSAQQHRYSEDDLAVLSAIAKHLALVLERIETKPVSAQLRADIDYKRLRIVHEVGVALVSELDLRKLIHKISESIQNVLGIEYSDLLLFDPEQQAMKREAVGFIGRGLMKEDYTEPLCNSPAHIAFRDAKVVICDRAALQAAGKEVEAVRFLLEEGFQEACSVPLIVQDRKLGVLNVLSMREGAFTPDCVSLLCDIARPIAIAVDNALSYRQISELRDKLTREKEYLEMEIRNDSGFNEIVGQSAALIDVLEQVRTVADSDANVLILGETGTGKELIARALHRLSDRHERSFVKLNCAAIPSELLESELFGHEKGSFTGACANKMGLLELAHGGTLFLDEVGDLPLNLQPKLLRVLQEHQLTRVGSTRMIAVDFRLVAATNRDLREMVSKREFRSDLYYRLNVFPLSVPALRERKGDIPILVRHFVQKFARERKRKIESIPAEGMKALTEWSWPGNIRELENVIERAVILSRGTVLNLSVAEFQNDRVGSLLTLASDIDTLLDSAPSVQERETREKILRALKESRGVIAGPSGAAARLGLKRTTLLWKMQRLGIRAHREFK